MKYFNEVILIFKISKIQIKEYKLKSICKLQNMSLISCILIILHINLKDIQVSSEFIFIDSLE